MDPIFFSSEFSQWIFLVPSVSLNEGQSDTRKIQSIIPAGTGGLQWAIPPARLGLSGKIRKDSGNPLRAFPFSQEGTNVHFSNVHFVRESANRALVIVF